MLSRDDHLALTVAVEGHYWPLHYRPVPYSAVVHTSIWLDLFCFGNLTTSAAYSINMAIVQLLVVLSLASTTLADSFGGWQNGRATHYGTDGEQPACFRASQTNNHDLRNLLHSALSARNRLQLGLFIKEAVVTAGWTGALQQVCISNRILRRMTAVVHACAAPVSALSMTFPLLFIWFAQRRTAYSSIGISANCTATLSDKSELRSIVLPTGWDVAAISDRAPDYGGSCG